MYVETVPNRNSPPAILLREGWRAGAKVRKRTLANLSAWPPAKVAALRKLLKNQPLVSPQQAFSIVSSRPHGHVELLLEAFRRLRLPQLLDRSPSPQRSTVLAMIAQRLLQPASQLASTRLWHSTTLAAELNLQDATADSLYQALDWLLLRQQRIEKRLAQRHLQEGAQGLYDVSSSYYEASVLQVKRPGREKRPPVAVEGVWRGEPGREEQAVHTRASAGRAGGSGCQRRSSRKRVSSRPAKRRMTATRASLWDLPLATRRW